MEDMYKIKHHRKGSSKPKKISLIKFNQKE